MWYVFPTRSLINYDFKSGFYTCMIQYDCDYFLRFKIFFMKVVDQMLKFVIRDFCNPLRNLLP